MRSFGTLHKLNEVPLKLFTCGADLLHGDLFMDPVHSACHELCFKMLILEKESCPVNKLLSLCSQILSLLQNFLFTQALSSSQPRNGPLGILGSNLSVEQQKLLNKLATVLKAQRCTEFNSRGMESC